MEICTNKNVKITYKYSNVIYIKSLVQKAEFNNNNNKILIKKTLKLLR